MRKKASGSFYIRRTSDKHLYIALAIPFEGTVFDKHPIGISLDSNKKSKVVRKQKLKKITVKTAFQFTYK